MARPAGVTASAVVALIGSAITALFAGLICVTSFTSPPPPDVPRAFIYGAALGLAALGGLGVATAIGLFRLRPWARVSIMVFGGITAAFCLMSMLVLVAIPLPMPPGSQVDTSTLRKVVIGVYAVPVLIGVWWLVQFNRPNVKQAFAAGDQGQPSLRPLSISIIGWWMLIGGVGTIIPAFIAMPAFIGGAIFTGWGARLVYVFFAAISSYVGWGLLKLDERARLVGIAYVGLGMAHVAFVLLSPGARKRMQEVQSMYAEQVGQTPADAAVAAQMTGFTTAIMAISILILAAGLWFLLREKRAFQSPTI